MLDCMLRRTGAWSPAPMAIWTHCVELFTSRQLSWEFKCTLLFLSPQTKSELRHLAGWIWLMNLTVFGGLSPAALDHLSYLTGLQGSDVKLLNTVIISQVALSTQLLERGRNLKVHEGNLTSFSSACQIFWSSPLAKSMSCNSWRNLWLIKEDKRFFRFKTKIIE